MTDARTARARPACRGNGRAPGAIPEAFACAAAAMGLARGDLAALVDENFARLFG